MIRLIGHPLSAALLTLIGVCAAAAQHGHSVVVEVEGPVLAAPVPSPPVVHEGMVAAPVAPAVECCPIAVVREVATRSARRAYRCHGAPVDRVLCVDSPIDCCRKFYSVAVCVPACCVDQPVCVDSAVGLLGRGHVTYRWKCGFEATITFLVRGGVIVTYR